MKKTPHNIYNPYLPNLTPGSGIAYDKKVLQELGTYIQDHLWEKMNKDWVARAAFVLDDPLMHYDNDEHMLKMLLKCFLPTVKKILHVDAQHPLKDRIKTHLRKEGLVDRLIQRNLDFYHNHKRTNGLIAGVFGEDQGKPTAKTLISHNIPQTEKTLIANILVLMILEEELTQKKPVKKIRKSSKK